MIPQSGKRSRKYARYILVSISVLVVASMLANSGLAEVIHLIQLPQQQEPPQKVQEPLTDVAPPPPAVDVRADEGPEARLKALGLDKLPELPAEPNRLPPGWTKEMVANPPQWTTIIAMPSDKPMPPDPFKAPVIAMNPERGQPADAPLPWAVQPQPDQPTGEATEEAK